MLAKESGSSEFDLPVEVLELLPSDPLEQLDVARKIKSLAISTRPDHSRPPIPGGVPRRLSPRDRRQTRPRDQEKEGLVKERAVLSNTVRKLNKDVSKSGASEVVANPSNTVQAEENLSSRPHVGHGVQSTFSEAGSTFHEDRDTDASRARIAHSVMLASQTSTPRLTPPGSPPIYSASTSPTRTSKPVSPKRHSMSFGTSRGIFDNRSSAPSSHHSSERGRTRVDGKEFFRQVRSRLSYEQFGALLANVKVLNGKQANKRGDATEGG
ncbi:uncharacterized protein At4g15545 [Pyrus x bretschneideri]|uniref:uncharacterized protein At4g15545 n=1 Tax=Pyrus x bretschneideri TaxID=225117 RepID=UPI00202E36C7|nr:uncharacterized protein At4g15545 [Pyrus x bretschneideri]